MIWIIITSALMVLGVVGWVYELRHETEEDKQWKMWKFNHGFH